MLNEVGIYISYLIARGSGVNPHAPAALPETHGHNRVKCDKI